MTELRFRCTYCQALIPWALDKKDLGLKPEESFVAGQVYPYEKCKCGWGKFVLCEGSGAKTGPAEAGTTAEGRVREKMDLARYMKVALDLIDPNPHQPRKFFEAEALASLADSIRKVGLLEDIVVRPVQERRETHRLAGAPANDPFRLRVVSRDSFAIRGTRTIPARNVRPHEWHS